MREQSIHKFDLHRYVGKRDFSMFLSADETAEDIDRIKGLLDALTRSRRDVADSAAFRVDVEINLRVIPV